MMSGKSYEVKEWFANKVADEVQKNITMCSVFAIMKETDKAVYAMLNLGCNFRKCMWVPKSVLVEYEVGNDKETGKHKYETLFIDYEEAVTLFKEHWDLFK